MTLIEVVAGLVLLATVFAAVAVARGRFVRQWADADRQLRATRAADALLADWLGGPPDRVPTRGGGPLAGTDGFTWRTRPARDPGADRLGSQVVRLEVFAPAGAERPGEGGASDGTSRPDAPGRPPAPVLTVEFLIRADPAVAGDRATSPEGVAPR